MPLNEVYTALYSFAGVVFLILISIPSKWSIFAETLGGLILWLMVSIMSLCGFGIWVFSRIGNDTGVLVCAIIIVISIFALVSTYVYMAKKDMTDEPENPQLEERARPT